MGLCHGHDVDGLVPFRGTGGVIRALIIGLDYMYSPGHELTCTKDAQVIVTMCERAGVQDISVVTDKHIGGGAMTSASAALPGQGPGRACPGRLRQARRAALGGLAAALAQAWLCQLPAFVPPRAASAGALAGAEGLGNPRAPALRPARSESPVILGGVVRKTKWVKVASNIINVRKNGIDQYSSKPYKKELKKANFLAAKDAKVNEFMSFARPSPVGGEYNMPVEVAREHLSQMYGREPTLETLTMEDEDGSVSGEDFRNLNTMRRKMDPTKGTRSRPRRRAKMHIGNMPGVSKYIGSLPKSEGRKQEPYTGAMGVHGGSQSDEFQDVWLSGGSISYNFDPDDQPMNF